MYGVLQALFIMGRKDKRIQSEGRTKFREFLSMNQRLHEMLRFLGECIPSSI